MDAQKNDPTDEIDFSKGIVGFAIKSLILSLAIVFCFNALVPDIPKIPETERKCRSHRGAVWRSSHPQS